MPCWPVCPLHTPLAVPQANNTLMFYVHTLTLTHAHTHTHTHTHARTHARMHARTHMHAPSWHSSKQQCTCSHSMAGSSQLRCVLLQSKQALGCSCALYTSALNTSAYMGRKQSQYGNTSALNTSACMGRKQSQGKQTLHTLCVTAVHTSQHEHARRH
jgi:hypothetical protein